jgi:hypothetical protein
MKNQDILILLSILTWKGPKRTYQRLSQAIDVNTTPILHAVRRLEASGLYSDHFQKVNIPKTIEFIVHGLKYVFPNTQIDENAPDQKGFLTGISHPIFNNEINSKRKFIWPSEKGSHWGIPIQPIHPSIPDKCLQNVELLELFALIEVLRIGRIREIEIAEKKIIELLRQYDS